MAVSSEQVLIYDPQGTAAKAKGVFLRQKIRMRPVAPEQMGQLVGVLVGLKGWEEHTCDEQVQTPQDSVLVFAGLSGPRLDGVLAALRRAGVPPTVYKAVVTADNAGWTFAALCAELARERQALETGGTSAHPKGGAEG